MVWVKGQSGNPKGRGTLVSEMVKRRVIYKAWEKKDKRMSDNDATQIVLKDMINRTDITTLGEKIIPIYGGQSTKGISLSGHDSSEADIPTE